MSANKVLVTGASGFIAAHVLDLLLKQGFSVRGTVRSQKKADQIIAKYPQYKDKLEFAIVEDISKSGAFEGTLDGVVGIFHLASPFTYKVTDIKADLLDPAINGTVGILETASKAPHVKRVVITSSFAAIWDFSKPHSYVYTEEDWNPVTFEQAVSSNSNGRIGYVASKKLAEQAAHDFMRTHKPHFDIVTLCPPMVYGPIVHHIDKIDELNESARTFYEVVSGKIDNMTPGLDVYVDVRDLATAHLLAYKNPQASNQRYLITNGNYNWQEVVDYAHTHFPNQTKAHKGTPGTFPPKSVLTNNAKSINHLGLTYTPKDTTYHDIIAQLIELEKKL